MLTAKRLPPQPRKSGAFGDPGSLSLGMSMVRKLCCATCLVAMAYIRARPAGAPRPLQQELIGAARTGMMKRFGAKATKCLDGLFQVPESVSKIEQHSEQGPVISHMDQNACGHGVCACANHRKNHTHAKQNQ